MVGVGVGAGDGGVVGAYVGVGVGSDVGGIDGSGAWFTPCCPLQLPPASAPAPAPTAPRPRTTPRMIPMGLFPVLIDVPHFDECTLTGFP